MPKTSSNDNKSTLLAYKEKILQGIKYYDQRIKDVRASAASEKYFEEGSSSDSEDDFPTSINVGLSVPQLKIQQSQFRTCFQATQELTSLQVLESEVNVMVDDPVIQGELPVKEPGLWREVTAECHIDLVPFSIMFYFHQPSRQFSAPSYRGLKVLPVKTAHEAELSTSVLAGVSRPADSIQVLRSYASAYRSRRTTLARLADKFASDLYMEPMAKGGYLLKCADLLEMSWRLENKWSPVGAFHHKMKFDLEYMDESYIKVITQAHKQLSDPTLETDERTLLLAKIISTCLEAQGTKENDSMESDAESVNRLKKKRSNEDMEPVAKKKKEVQNKDVNNDKENRDDQIMAPPKSLPKKVKPKVKDNTGENRKAVKRSNVEDGDSNVKKAKTDDNGTSDVRQSVNDKVEGQIEHENEKNEMRNDNRDQNNAITVSSEKNKGKVACSQNKQKESDKGNDNAKDVKKTKKKQDGNKNVDEGITKNADKENPNDMKEKTASEVQEKTKKKVVKATESQKVASKDNLVANAKNDNSTKEVQSYAVTKKDKKTAISKNNPKTKNSQDEKLAGEDHNIANSKNDVKSAENTVKKNTANGTNAETEKHKEKVAKIVKKSDNQDKTSKNQKAVESININKKNKNSANAKKIAKNTTHADVENAKKHTENPKQLEGCSESGANIESSAANKETENKTAKATDIATTKKDKNMPKNKTEVANAKKVANPKSNQQRVEKQPVKIIETQKTNTLKPKAIANPKNTDKDTAKTKMDEEITLEKAKLSQTSKKIVPNNAGNNLNKNSTTNNKADIIEKVSKVKNVAMKNKELIVKSTENKVASVKNDPTIANKKTQIQNKMVIKNLSHKNPSAKDKLSRRSVAGNTDKKVKASNIAKNFKTGNTVQETASASKISKIPQKKFSPISESNFRNNPLRISPRKFPSTFKSSSDSNLKQKTLQKPLTNIPRLLKKPEPKRK